MEQCISCKYCGNDIERDPCRGCTFGSGFGSNWEPAGEKSQWIPVTERLPEKVESLGCSCPVLAFGKQRLITNTCIDVIKVAEYHPDHDYWTWIGGVTMLEDVSAWMPLPEAPEKL